MFVQGDVKPINNNNNKSDLNPKKVQEGKKSPKMQPNLKQKDGAVFPKPC